MPFETDFDIFLLVAFAAFVLLITFDLFFIIRNIHRYRKAKERFRFHFRYLWHYSFLTNYLFIILLLVFGYLFYFKTDPKIISSVPETEMVWESYDDPIQINFNVPVDRNRLIVNMNPLLKGRWEWQPYLGVSRFTKTGKFYPEETLFPNERIVIYLTGIARVGVSESHEGGIVLQSVSLPEVQSTMPFHRTKNTNVDQEIKLLFNKEIDNLAEVSFKITPEIEFEVVNDSPTLFSIKPTADLEQSTEYVLTVQRTPKRINLATKEVIEKDNPQTVHRLEFTTVKEPFIKSISPKGSGIKPDAQIRFRFETEMEQETTEQNISYSPAINGTYTWQDGRTLVYVPTEPLQKETKYTITIAPGLKSIYGGVSDKSITQEFETIGKIKITENSPANGQIKVGISSDISVTFDQEVNHDSAQQKFSISPNAAGSFRWEGNKMIYDVASLSYATNYTVTLAAGIESLYGINSDQPYSFGFSTRGQEVIISMPWYPQPQSPVSFTCNIVSAQMALAWKGYNTSPAGLIGELGYDTGYADGHWTGNPYQRFVGCSDGYCGYGVYWTALKRLFDNRGIHTEIKTGSNIVDLARSIENGQPVIIWRYNGTSSNGDWDWTASDGTYIDGIRGQHGGVVTGYRGTVENPTAFYINDPWFGLIWMNVSTFDYYWSRLNRSSLVIY